MKKRIAILGSTGSIGTQALEVISNHPEHFQLEVITANHNAELLVEQAICFIPNVVVIANEEKYNYVNKKLANFPIKVYGGQDSLSQVVAMDSIDIVLTALVGYSGLLPTIAAIKAKKNIALANKESMVVAGELISKLAYEKRVAIIPVDSEHSAIFQCLAGEKMENIEKIYLTASGGPFLGKSKEFLSNVSIEQALKHPNWEMGAKITIDSASLMNKGLEVIEAKWLFGLKHEQIDVIVHPQSIIHSIVQFADGSMKAQMGLPDMKLPILYALTFPDRLKSTFKRFNFLDYPNLTFEKPDVENFKNLALAYEAMKTGGNIPCALNAANEITVNAFLNRKLQFIKMPDIIKSTMERINYIKTPDLSDYVETDKQAREISKKLINNNINIK